MDLATFSSLNPDDKPIADGYAMMASLLQNRLNNDSSLSSADRQELTNVMHWFEGAEKVNRGEGSLLPHQLNSQH